MGRQIITEADRRRAPPPPTAPGQAPSKGAGSPRGQAISRERGTATRNKKNPGKRAHQGG